MLIRQKEYTIKNRRGYVCGAFNKHEKKVCTYHTVRESNLSILILSDIKYFINSSYKAMLDLYSSELDVLSNRKSTDLIKLIDEIISKDEYDYFL